MTCTICKEKKPPCIASPVCDFEVCAHCLDKTSYSELERVHKERHDAEMKRRAWADKPQFLGGGLGA